MGTTIIFTYTELNQITLGTDMTSLQVTFSYSDPACLPTLSVYIVVFWDTPRYSLSLEAMSHKLAHQHQDWYSVVSSPWHGVCVTALLGEDATERKGQCAGERTLHCARERTLHCAGERMLCYTAPGRGRYATLRQLHCARERRERPEMAGRGEDVLCAVPQR